ncbi:MAG: DUF2161 domain-containing phosphodiesterase [Gammaproteobacteria bacterium]
MPETDLYPAVKHLLESQGYEVKSEITDCDVVAVRGEEPPVVVELKLAFNLSVLLQAVNRQAITDDVYIAFAAGKAKSANSLWRRHRKDLLKLCRRLGLGLMSVDNSKEIARAVEIHLDPAPYTPRKDKKRAGRLLKEFANRQGDPNKGGSSKQPLMTAYRQDAMRCLFHIGRYGPSRVRDIKEQTGVERTASILQKNYYGWFERIERGVYGLTPSGTEALQSHGDRDNDLLATPNPKVITSTK